MIYAVAPVVGAGLIHAPAAGAAFHTACVPGLDLATEAIKPGAWVLPYRHQRLGCPKSLHGEGTVGDKPPIARASWGSATGGLASSHYQDAGIGL